MPAPLSPPLIAHPAWCSPLLCDADAGHADIRHSSTPDAWTPTDDDVLVSVSLHRDDERHPDSTLTAHGGVVLTLENTACLAADGAVLQADVLLTGREARHLARQLLALAALAEPPTHHKGDQR